MIDHVIKRFAGQRDVQVVHVREVGGSQLAGPMDLIEKDLARLVRISVALHALIFRCKVRSSISGNRPGKRR